MHYTNSLLNGIDVTEKSPVKYYTSLIAFSCMLDATASISSLELNLRLVQADVKLGTAFSGCGYLLCRHVGMS